MATGVRAEDLSSGRTPTHAPRPPPSSPVTNRRRYRKRTEALVSAVQLRLDTAGFTYRKWGAEQRCKPGDWVVDNAGDVYTIDAGVFAATYQAAGPGLYRKVGTVWAVQATTPGAVDTKEGRTSYDAGDYLVSNDEAGEDTYAVTRERFESMYEPL